MKNINSRKGKVPYLIWITQEEEKGLLEIIGDGTFFRRVGEFIGKIYKRGDLKKR